MTRRAAALRSGETSPDSVALHRRSRPARIVEIGVGTGLVALPLTERGYTVLGVDLSSKMIAVRGTHRCACRDR